MTYFYSKFSIYFLKGLNGASMHYTSDKADMYWKEKGE